MAKVYAPLATYNGVSASIHFVDGVGETDNEDLLKWFTDHNYKVVDDEDKPKKATKKATKKADVDE